ncbi:S-protein secretion component K [Vibrio fluvialis]|uniref:S-protein secretion component K n=1 Tax=Vibrio fluvialis TaxID=676 RepID=UPI001C9D9C7E|nr:S-protein secretion component K [Vibrio fluvialis]
MNTNQQGVVLPLTLIIVAVLTLMVSILLGRSYHSMNETRVMREQWEARLKIHSAEQSVQFAIMVGIQSPGAYQLGDVQLRTDGSPTKLSSGVWVSIQDQSGLLSLRFLRKGLLRQLMRSYFPEPMAGNIVDNIIRYQTPNMRDSKLESIMPREALFRSLDELMLISGISPELYNGAVNTTRSEGASSEKIGEVEEDADFGPKGLRDFLTLSGSERMNPAAIPNELLRRVFALNQQDIDRLERLKDRRDWNGVVSSLSAVGLDVTGVAVPSSFYIIRFQYNGVQARGDYQIRSTTLPPRKRDWFFPDSYRYFDLPKY